MTNQLQYHSTHRTFRLAAGLVAGLLIAFVGSAQAQVAQGVDIVMADGLDSPSSFVNWENMPLHAVDMSPDGTTLAVVNITDNRVEFFDLSSGQPVPSGAVQVGLDPVTVRWRPDGTQIWVVNHISDTISVIDNATRRVVATLQTEDEPYDLVFAGDPERVFVTASQRNLVQVMDPGALETASSVRAAVVNTIPINGEDPRAMVVSPDGTKIYVAVFESSNATTLIGGGDRRWLIPNIAGGDSAGELTQEEPYTGGPYGGTNPPPNIGGPTNRVPSTDWQAFDPPINREYLPDGAFPAPGVALIVKKNAAGRWMDDNGGDWTRWVSGPDAPLTLRLVGWDMPDRDVAVIDVATETVTGYARSLMNMVMGIGVNPATGAVTAVGTDAINEIRFEPVLNGKFTRVNLGIVNPDDLDNPTVVDLNAGHLDYTIPTIPQRERVRSIGDPRGIVWNNAGTRGYVTGMGSNNIAIIDQDGRRVGAEQLEVAEGPVGIVLDESRQQLYVLSHHGGTNLTTVSTASESVVASVPLFDPSPTAMKMGRIHLYGTHETSGLGQTSCGACHVDARIDQLSWDLGNPAGQIKPVIGTDVGDDPNPGPNANNLNAGASQAGFGDHHPMKGPLTTQTLQDIIGKEPLHHRSDQAGLEGFNSAFVGLQGSQQLTAEEMQEFEDFLDTIVYPPNPNRYFDNSLPIALDVTGLYKQYATGRYELNDGDALPVGNARNGLIGITTNPVRGAPATRCVSCHTLPTGQGTPVRWDREANMFKEIPHGPNGEAHLALKQSDTTIHRTNKSAGWRNFYERTGTWWNQPESRLGFGFMNDGREDTITRRAMARIFNFGSDQAVADFIALTMSYTGSDMENPNQLTTADPPGPPSNDTHAAVGKQITVTDDRPQPLFGEFQAIRSMIELASKPDRTRAWQSAGVDLVVKGTVDGVERGFVYDRSFGMFRSDIDGETLTPEALRALAAVGGELTYTAVPRWTGVRIGIDRDEDGVGDRTEIMAGSNPADAASRPSNANN